MLATLRPADAAAPKAGVDLAAMAAKMAARRRK